MLFKVIDNWKQNLSYDDEKLLNDLLKKVSRNRGAYRTAHDIKTAQLWSACLELRKENLLLKNKVERIERIFDGICTKKHEENRKEQDLVKSLENF
ncbi:MAG: hypothetical protein HY832_00670 [Candidatus Aenigmarchaeota archaeon]|nr:hypothetical protein [Candidatus Aenigmarchaeota archaeon]